MAKWEHGEPDDLEWLQGWCTALREHVKAGRSIRRARVVSEPLSDYQRWSRSIAYPMVEAGEDIRWVPRGLVSSVALPGTISTYSMTAWRSSCCTRGTACLRACSARPTLPFCGCAAPRSRPSGRYRYRTASTPPSSSGWLADSVTTHCCEPNMDSHTRLGLACLLTAWLHPHPHSPAQEAPMALRFLGKDPDSPMVAVHPCGTTATRTCCKAGEYPTRPDCRVATDRWPGPRFPNTRR